jgi:hypothetical protein
MTRPPIQQTMTAIRKGTLAEFQAKLAQYPDLLDEYGVPMLEHAAEHDRVDILEILLGLGVDINGASGMDTPLSLTARSASVATVEWLLDHGAEIDGCAQPRGSTPLHSAIEEGRLDMVEFLLDRGADPDILEGNPRRNAIAMARFWDHDDIVAFLESRGISDIVIVPMSVDVESEAFFDEAEPLGIVEWFEAKWGPVHEYGTKHGLDAMCDQNQILFLVGYLITQLADGGTDMVYANPSARYAPAMPWALEQIGAFDAAALIRQINACFPGGVPADDSHDRADQLQAIKDGFTALGEELDAIFEEMDPDNGVRMMLVQLHDYWHV